MEQIWFLGVKFVIVSDFGFVFNRSLCVFSVQNDKFFEFINNIENKTFDWRIKRKEKQPSRLLCKYKQIRFPHSIIICFNLKAYICFSFFSFCYGLVLMLILPRTFSLALWPSLCSCFTFCTRSTNWDAQSAMITKWPNRAVLADFHETALNGSVLYWWHSTGLTFKILIWLPWHRKHWMELKISQRIWHLTMKTPTVILHFVDNDFNFNFLFDSVKFVFVSCAVVFRFFSSGAFFGF